ncbi:MAG: bifunctional DNA-formamidopyrimidine glycosylase/DNA-(apurinic or apyrimidinic site) lyase [Alphaproteobacteria bacterium]|nr:bifunctional DNA-formamidopyrimidine glycosylase/DNA-(apurinic or apyrimidinic site) lyase [Alphaproteobacteria bacterium]
MPELPEVETVCRGIAPFIEGHVMRDVVTTRPNLRVAFPELFAERLNGHSVEQVKRRAKYILIYFKGGPCMVIHLGMSGQIKMVEPDAFYQPIKHDHMFLHFDDGRSLVYNDPRRFGFVLLYDNAAALEDDKIFKQMGPDPFSDAFTPAFFYDALKRRNSPIKTALLDQRLVVGLGNIYVCEALFMAHINPKRMASDVSRKEASALYAAILEVLEKAIKAGGSTLKDYRRADGKLGYFQHEFQVYGREGAPCFVCNKGEVHRIVQAGRSSFYCSACQKK